MYIILISNKLKNVKSSVMIYIQKVINIALFEVVNMKEKILKILTENDDYISGEEIGEILGISRAAVWKNIVKLREKGYKIESVSNRGYKLNDKVDILNSDEIKYEDFIHLEEIDSTNEEGKRRANNGCKSGLIIVSDKQTAGKGRLGREWSAKRNEGLYMSIVLRPDIMPQEAPQMTLIAGLAVMKTINKVIGVSSKIKWPNDIILNGKKLVGILTEMNAEMEKVNYIVVGIGINVNNESFGEELNKKATSIYIETGKKFKRSDIINEFVKIFEIYYNEFCKKGFSAFVEEYNENCANVGCSVKTVGGKKKIEGIAKGVNEKGEILIDSNDETIPVMAGEVSLRLSDNRYI